MENTSEVPTCDHSCDEFLKFSVAHFCLFPKHTYLFTSLIREEWTWHGGDNRAQQRSAHAATRVLYYSEVDSLSEECILEIEIHNAIERGGIFE
jgi:hypothetical protein